MPFFSVIIPLFNKESFVADSIKSILNQTFTDFEILIIDDCSTDNSLEVASQFETEKINVIRHKTNKGLSASRNTGIRNAKGRYIAFLDADDIWKPEFLEKINYLINQFTNAKLFATNYVELYPNNLKIQLKTTLHKDFSEGYIENFFESNLAQPIYFPSSLCVEKSVFESIGLYNEAINFGEDVDFNIRANTKFKLAYSKVPLVLYTMNSENQITKSSFKNKNITDFDFYESIASNNKSLKKYLDFNRYIMAKHYKLEGLKKEFDKMVYGISPENINFKQKILLNTPLFLLKIIQRIKSYFLSKGIRITTYN